MPFHSAGDILKRSSTRAAMPLPKVQLHIRRGRAKHIDRPVHGPVFLIGRSADCDLVLGDAHMPDVHAYLFVTPQGVTVRRIGAQPRLAVNGVPVEQAKLNHGDQITLGNYEFELSIIASTADASSGGRRASAQHAEGLALVRKLLLDVRFGKSDASIPTGSEDFEH